MMNLLQNFRGSLVASIILIIAVVVPASAVATVVNDRIESIVAIVNNDIITSLELNKQIEQLKAELRQQRIDVPSDDVLQKQVLERLIIMRIQLQTANKRNIRIDDETLNGAIENIANQNRMDLLQFRQALQSTGINYSDYRERIRSELIIAQLQKRLVNSRVIVTSQEIDDYISNQELQGSDKDEYRLEHILVSIPETATPEQIQAAKKRALSIRERLVEGADFVQMAIAESDGQQALTGGDLGWRKMGQIPLLFADWVNTMTEGDISELVRSPSGFHIIKLAEKRRDQKQYIVKQTHARHILIIGDDPAALNQARVRLEQLRERIENGESFTELAAAHSDDKGSASSGGDLGWVSPGVMVREFEEQMDQLQPDQISEPFRSRFGWHIVQVLERRDFDNTESFQRKVARETLLKRKLEPAVQNWVRRLRDESFVEVRI